MYTILMNSDKHLTKTVITVLHQNENLVDKFKFIVPRTYNGIDMLDFKTMLMYTAPSGEERSEVIKLSGEAYKEKWLCGYLPIDSQLTRLAGEVALRLVFVNNGRILQSGQTTITIDAVKGPGISSPDDVPSDESDIHEGFEVVEF